VGALQHGGYCLADTDPTSSVSLVPLNESLRGVAPAGFVAIAFRPDGDGSAFLGLWRNSPRSLWLLTEWRPGNPGEKPPPHDAIDAIRAMIEGEGRRGKRDRRTPLPTGLHRHYCSPTEWFSDGLAHFYSWATPTNWRDAAAWDRYYERQRRMKDGRPGNYSFVFFQLLGTINPELPVLFLGNGTSRDPLEFASLGGHAVVVDIARHPIKYIRRQELARLRKTQPDTLAEVGWVETICCDVFDYRPSLRFAAIVASHFHYGFHAEVQEALIARLHDWLAPGGLCYIHTGIDEGNRLFRDASPWDRHGFMVRGAITNQAFMELRRTMVPDGEGIRTATPEGVVAFRAAEAEEAAAEAAHAAAGGRFLRVVFGG
jgi:hypothetical protein